MIEQGLDIVGNHHRTRARRNLAAWSMLAALLLFAAMAGPFFAGRVYTADDLGAFHVPLRAFYAECLAEGDSFDWMPQLFSGFYLTGEGQAGPYHPVHQILYRFLPLHAALAWESLVSYPLMMLGTWFWLRRRLGQTEAAAFGGLLFAFCSFNLVHFVHPNAVAVIAHLPWLLWAIDIVLVDSRRRRVALAAAAIALLTGSQLLLGYPQYVWFSWLTETAYVVFLEITRKFAARSECDRLATCDDCVGCTTRTWHTVAVAVGIGLLIGGVQLLPTLDAWLHSSRASADAAFASWGSLHPLNLLQLVAPYLFIDRVIGGNTHEIALYAGAVPLMLAVWVVVRRRELGSLAPLAWASLGFAVFTILLAFGSYGYVGRIFSVLPVVGSFRCPCRYTVLFQLGIAVLAAIGFRLLCRDAQRARGRAGEETIEQRHARLSLRADFEPLGFVVAASIVVALVWSLRREPCVASFPKAMLGPALLATAAALIVAAARGRAIALVGLILLAALDLGCYGMTYAVYPAAEALDQYAASALTPPGRPDGRVLASLLRYNQPGIRVGNAMILQGWRRADGYAGLEPARTLDYRSLNALRAAGVRWILRNPDTEQIAGLIPFDSRWLEVPDPMPRIRLVSQACVSADPAAEIATIPLETTALCELPLGLSESTPGEAALVSEKPGRLEIDVNCPAPQLLVVAESYHPGWKAEIDGVPQTVYRINGDFLGCLPGPGEHRVIFRFQPESLRTGQWASFLGLCMVYFSFLGCPAASKSNRRKDLLP